MKRKVNDGNLGLIAPSLKRQRKVDPETGEPSSAANAISRPAFDKRKKVDPETGEPSSASDAILINTFRARQKVDPVTGAPSSTSDAISRYAFRGRQMVDPKTGELSSALNAISRNTYHTKKRRNEIVVSTTEEPSLTSGLTSNHYSQVQPLSSRQIGSFKKDPLPMGWDVNDVSLREKITEVNQQTIISKDAASDNCEVQAVRLLQK